MVQAILATYESRLTANTWLGADTRATAIKKLKTMAIHVGYPDEPRPLYGQMQTVPAAEGGTLLGNAMAFMRLSKLDNYNKWNMPVRDLWPLSADTVNAMYSPLDNSINFPAAHPTRALLQSGTILVRELLAASARSSRMKSLTPLYSKRRQVRRIGQLRQLVDRGGLY